MCGLIGYLGEPVASPEDLLARVAHRGPDRQGYVDVPGAFLGHTRLAIQDPDPRSDQPFRDGPITLTYNGEVWDAASLAETLPAGSWRTQGDTEVVARLLAVEGVGGLDRVDGMFAVAWHNATSGQVWVARDRWGKIPLYLSESLEGTWWASEIKALPRGPAEAVAPGTARNLTTGQVVKWATPAETAPLEDPAQVRDVLRRGVVKRFRSDRPVCFLLSGGLDSALTLGLARDVAPDPVAYHAVFDPDSADLQSARRVAAHFDVPLIEVPVPDPTPRSIRDAVHTVEVPMKAQVEIALGCLPLARAIASDGFRVVLSGEAADEVFGGYGSMAIASTGADDARWREIRAGQVEKMARGNFLRLNKVFMAAGVEARMPFMERDLVEGVLAASKSACPPGKGLLKAAAKGIVPDDVVRRPKDTFQGASGLAAAAATALNGASPVKMYNAIARSAFGFLPRG